MEQHNATVNQYLGFAPVTFHRLVLSFLIFLMFIGAKKLFNMYAGRRIEDANKRHMATKTMHYLFGIISLVILAVVWFEGSANIFTYLGILSAGLAIALQDLLVNMAGWIFIVVRKPFVVGDRIEIGEHAGDVIDIRLFQFTLMEVGNWVDADQSTGRIIHIPNGWVYKKTTANFSQGFNYIWNELPVTVTFESDWEKAKSTLTRIANRQCLSCSKKATQQLKTAENKYMILFKYLTPIVWTSVVDNGVTLTVRYLCLPRDRRISTDKMWEEILKAFSADEDIDFAYPTWRIYKNVKAGSDK